jgi:hypothetical protein
MLWLRLKTLSVFMLRPPALPQRQIEIQLFHHTHTHSQKSAECEILLAQNKQDVRRRVEKPIKEHGDATPRTHTRDARAVSEILFTRESWVMEF